MPPKKLTCVHRIARTEIHPNIDAGDEIIERRLEKCFCGLTFDVVDTSAHFFEKLREFVGSEITVEGPDYSHFRPGSFVISFHTYLVQFQEGESHDVTLSAMRDDAATYGWRFTEIEKTSSLKPKILR